MLIQLEESQLVMLDYSTEQLREIEKSSEILNTAKSLCEVSKLLNVPIWGAEQSLPSAGGMHVDLRGNCKKIVSKANFDASEHGLIDLLKGPIKSSAQGNARSLPKHLQKQEAPLEKMTILIAGCETHQSVLQTALGLVDQEFDVCLVTDACASIKSHNHDSALDRLAGAGVELVTMEMVVFEWLGSSEHPSYAKVMKLIGR